MTSLERNRDILTSHDITTMSPLLTSLTLLCFGVTFAAAGKPIGGRKLVIYCGDVKKFHWWLKTVFLVNRMPSDFYYFGPILTAVPAAWRLWAWLLDTIAACDRRTDGQTDTRAMHTAYAFHMRHKYLYSKLKSHTDNIHSVRTEKTTEYDTIRYDTIRYGRLTCAQKLTRWPA